MIQYTIYLLLQTFSHIPHMEPERYDPETAVISDEDFIPLEKPKKQKKIIKLRKLPGEGTIGPSKSKIDEKKAESKTDQKSVKTEPGEQVDEENCKRQRSEKFKADERKHEFEKGLPSIPEEKKEKHLLDTQIWMATKDELLVGLGMKMEITQPNSHIESEAQEKVLKGIQEIKKATNLIERKYDKHARGFRMVIANGVDYRVPASSYKTQTIRQASCVDILDQVIQRLDLHIKKTIGSHYEWVLLCSADIEKFLIPVVMRVRQEIIDMKFQEQDKREDLRQQIMASRLERMENLGIFETMRKKRARDW